MVGRAHAVPGEGGCFKRSRLFPEAQVGFPPFSVTSVLRVARGCRGWASNSSSAVCGLWGRRSLCARPEPPSTRETPVGWGTGSAEGPVWGAVSRRGPVGREGGRRTPGQASLGCGATSFLFLLPLS